MFQCYQGCEERVTPLRYSVRIARVIHRICSLSRVHLTHKDINLVKVLPPVSAGTQVVVLCINPLSVVFETAACSVQKLVPRK